MGALVMLIIGANYHYLINKYPDATGGTMSYTANLQVFLRWCLSEVSFCAISLPAGQQELTLEQ